MKKKSFVFLILIFFIYLFINFIFNFHFWQDIIKPSQNNILVTQGESPIYEYVAERVRLNILSGNNPFKETKDIMYPFGWNFALDDIAPINGFYFLFLRPFFSIHQSLMLIVLLGILVGNISMYVLLRRLNLSKFTSFLFGLIYGFTPFISYRIGGHPTYTSIYLFPFIGIVLHLLLDKKNDIRRKFIYSILLGFLLSVTLLTNLYYFVMVGLLAIILLIFWFVRNASKTLLFLRKNYKFFFISLLSFVLILLPWLIKAFEFLSTNSYSRQLRTIDYIPFSADVFNIFLPSRFNPFYNLLIKSINLDIPSYLASVFEDFIYPGIIIILSYIFAVFNYKKLTENIRIYFWVSLFFLVLSFGPYLKIAGKVTSIPMPFLVFQSFPYIQLARAPGRFIVVFIFLASIVSAYILDLIIKKYKIKKLWLLASILLVIFFLDQTYISSKGVNKNLPLKIYSNIKKQKQGAVLNIPFTIRDGLRNLGHPDGIWEPYSELIHEKPIYSIYAGRLSDDIFNYYENNYMFGLLDNLINKKNTNALTYIDKNRFDRSLDFFDVKFILLKTDEFYSAEVNKLINDSNFNILLVDKNYTLFERGNENKQEFLKADFGSAQDDFVLFDGWYNPEIGYRWTHGKITKSLFKVNNKRPMELKLKAEAIVEPQIIKIFIRDKYINTITIENGKVKDYKVDLGENLNVGLNTIIFKFKKSYNLGKVTGNKKDIREVSLNVKELSIEDSK